MITRNINTALDRIQIATPDSPIAVWRAQHAGKPALRVAFGDTVVSRAESVRPDFIGMFHREMDMRSVKRTLKLALADGVSA